VATSEDRSVRPIQSGYNSCLWRATTLGCGPRPTRTLFFFFLLPPDKPRSALLDPPQPVPVILPLSGSLLFSDAGDPHPQTLRPRRPHHKTLSFRACSAASTAARLRRRHLRGAPPPPSSAVHRRHRKEGDHHPHRCLLAKGSWPTTTRTLGGVCGATRKPHIERGIGFPGPRHGEAPSDEGERTAEALNYLTHLNFRVEETDPCSIQINFTLYCIQISYKLHQTGSTLLQNSIVWYRPILSSARVLCIWCPLDLITG
jgi:hypothetical protein